MTLKRQEPNEASELVSISNIRVVWWVTFI